MKPFLILQLRPEDEAADEEFASFLSKGGLLEHEVHRIRLDQRDLPGGLVLADYSGVIVGGGPGCVSDKPEDKTPQEAKIEAEILGLMPRITEGDVPFLGCCYGLGILAHHLGGEVSKARYGEPIGGVDCTLSEAGAGDPLFDGLPREFRALVGHKEAVQALPPGAVHLVHAERCPVQMIRYRRNVYATQFHPEADGQSFATRIRIYRGKGYFHPDEADSLTQACLAEEISVPERILSNFVDRYRSG